MRSDLILKNKYYLLRTSIICSSLIGPCLCIFISSLVRSTIVLDSPKATSPITIPSRVGHSSYISSKLLHTSIPDLLALVKNKGLPIFSIN